MYSVYSQPIPEFNFLSFLEAREQGRQFWPQLRKSRLTLPIKQSLQHTLLKGQTTLPPASDPSRKQCWVISSPSSVLSPGLGQICRHWGPQILSNKISRTPRSILGAPCDLSHSAQSSFPCAPVSRDAGLIWKETERKERSVRNAGVWLLCLSPPFIPTT